MDKSMTSRDVRDIIDWDYYITRLNTTIMKIVVIPGIYNFWYSHAYSQRYVYVHTLTHICSLESPIATITSRAFNTTWKLLFRYGYN